MSKKSTAEIRTLPDLATATLQTIQDLHSEMLATASDLGYEPPNDCLVEIEEGAEEAGREIVGRLHAALTEHHERMVLAAGKKEEHTAAEDAPVRASSKKSAADKMADQKAARLARDAAKQAAEPASTEEKTVAKTPKKAAKKAAKTAPKKSAKKAAKAAPKKAAKKSADGAGSRKAPEGKIQWIFEGEGNGVREGTGRHERRELLRRANGKTVKTYLENGGSIATLNRAVSEKAVKVVA